MSLYRVRVAWSGPAAVGGGLSTYHFSDVLTTPSAAHADVVTFHAAMASAVVNTNSWTVLSDVDEINPATGQVIGSSSVAAVTSTGSNAGDELPITSQALVRWRTGIYIGGRELRGRTFLPGFSLNNSQDGKPTTSLLTVVGNAATTLATGNGLVVYGRTSGSFADVQTASVWSQWASLRSRRD